MKKVVAFVGSPRKKGNSAALTAEIIRGAESVGAQAKVYFLNDMKIRPCQSCFSCRKEYLCSINDDMKPVYADIKEADAVVIGSPIYMLQVAAQTKLLFDRLFPLMDVSFYPRFGGKKTVMVYSQGHPDAAAFKHAFAANAEVLKMMGLQVEETLVCTNANQPDTAVADVKLMERAFEAGKKLAQ